MLDTQTTTAKQEGLALFTSLIMLLLMTLVVVTSARSSGIELLLGNNTQESVQSLMRAEDSAVEGEKNIQLNFSGAPTFDFALNPDDGYYATGQIVLDTVDWSTIAHQTVIAGTDTREFIMEYLGPFSATGGSLSLGAGVASDTRYLYRVSGRGASSRGSVRVVQTIYSTIE